MAVTKGNQIIKRVFEIICTLFIIVILSPLLIVVVLAVKLNSPGEVIFKQKRLGLNGKIFLMYKFRSMIANAENMGAGMFVEENDQRITFTGRILRKTSIDELPQLFNVFRGEMSLVGPRPAPLHHLPKYDERQRKRLNVRPGITGWAQVKGRLALYWPERIEMDVWYVENYSLWLDLIILVRSIGVVIFRRGGTARADRREADPFMKL